MPKLYHNLEDVFSKEKANELLVSSPYNHEIKLEGDCQPPYGLIYPLSTPKLQVRSTFVKLKEKFSSTPMLRHFNPEKAVHLETNASVFTITGILSQQGAGEPGVDWCWSTSTIEGDTAMHWHLVVFWSQTMVPTE